MKQKVPNTEELVCLLADVEHKWDKIGTGLKISGNNLIAAFRDNNDDRSRLSSVLASWKESKSTPTTWETIIDLMKSLECNSTKIKIEQFLTKQEVYSKYAHMKDFVEDVPQGKLFILIEILNTDVYINVHFCNQLVFGLPCVCNVNTL